MNTNLFFISKWEHEKGRVVDTQSHTCHELVFYDNGCTGITTIDGVEYRFSAGDVIINKKFSQHSEIHFTDGVCIFFGFDCDMEIQSGIHHDVWEVKPVVDAIVKEAREQNHNYKALINLKIQEILLLLDRNNNSSESGKLKKSLFYCKNYIDENYMQKIEVSNLAEMTNYSIDHFRHLFYRNFGMSPKSYIIKKRCEKAVELLSTTSHNCADIAYQCGFSDSGQMSKMIKKFYFKTPRQIRADYL